MGLGPPWATEQKGWTEKMDISAVIWVDRCLRQGVSLQPNPPDFVQDHRTEPDILKYEVKWALGSISMNQARGGDGIPAELFQILKDDVVKVLL